MAWFIDDYSRTKIRITDTIREWIIPKFRIDMDVEEPYLYLRWNDSEVSPNVPVRLLTMNYLEVVDNYSGYIDNPSSAAALMTQIDAMIETAWTDISTGGGDLLTAKGDLLSNDGISDTILPIGDNGEVLMANSAEPTGQKWTELIHSITFDSSGVKLVNDSATPGNSKYYGTDSGGTKGFHTVPLSSYVIGYLGTIASTNTVAEEFLGHILIPGGTLAVGDLVTIKLISKATSGVGSKAFNSKWHTATGTGGTVMSISSTAATQSMMSESNVLVTGASTQRGWIPAANLTYSVAAVDSLALTLAIASDIYVNITSTKTTGTDGSELRGAVVIIQKKR